MAKKEKENNRQTTVHKTHLSKTQDRVIKTPNKKRGVITGAPKQ